MCGICGFAGSGNRDDLARMKAALAHRGPDGEGEYIEEEASVFLGHRRLAIVDLAGGEQPMWNEDGHVGVVFNGEIYNHAELRAQLAARGHRFRSDHSDTEVLVHGYEEWGIELPRKLNGMFAFAIYDKRRRQFFLARDRFGEKPLYYCERPGFIAFASELTALARHSGVPRSIDPVSLQTFFAWGYLPAPRAMLDGTRKLPGGHWLRYDLGSGKTEVRPYWRFALEPDPTVCDGDEPRLVEECTALIDQAARRRLMSDVPVGLFLSGGIDSSVILASLCKELPASTLSTFTIGFDDPTFDESGPARVVADHFGTTHRQRTLSLSLVRDLIPEVLGRLDEPIGDPSLLPTYLLSAFAREQVTVALSGDGGDELFAGYDPLLAFQPALIYSRLMPRAGHNAARRLVDLMPIGLSNMSLDFKLRRSLIGLSHAASMWLPTWMAPLDPKDAASVFETPLRPDDVYADAIELWHRNPNLSFVERGLEFFTQFYLQDNILVKSDRAAMMSSLETRAVFLDNDLVDFCCRLPSRFKLKGNSRKYLLKLAARRLLPRDIINRKKKGFGVPLAKWLRDVPRELPAGELPNFHRSFLISALAAHRAGKSDHRLLIWCWLVASGFAMQITRRSVHHVS